ncbi:MAG: hypothetical protein KAT06_12310 [Gammaproteobacteria bacterium]|nr:hypothetical protein [Gammaproteobacteria bacterium]
MPITFTINHNDNYFVSSLKGTVTDDELLNSFKLFYESELWIPGMNELTDISEGDVSQITSDGMRKLAIFTEQTFRKNEVEFSKTAVYAPKDLPFGLSRMYEVMIDESPENFYVYQRY